MSKDKKPADPQQNDPGVKEERTYKISNTCSAPITLATRAQKVTILPGRTEAVSTDFMEEISANKAAMSFFQDGRLKEG